MQLARARRRVLVLDGRRPRNCFAPHSHGFFGQDGKSPAEIVGEATAQLAAYPTARIMTSEAHAAERVDGRFVVTYGDACTASAERLILATGMRDELSPLAGLDERWGVSMLHCPYCRLRGRGSAPRRAGDASAVDAMFVPDWGPTTWFTQSIVEPSTEEAALLDARRVTIERTRVRVIEVLGDAPRISGLRLEDGRIVAIDVLFVGRAAHASGRRARARARLRDRQRSDGADHSRGRMEADERAPSVFAAGDAATAWTNATFASAAGVAVGVAAYRSLVFGL